MSYVYGIVFALLGVTALCTAVCLYSDPDLNRRFPLRRAVVFALALLIAGVAVAAGWVSQHGPKVLAWHQKAGRHVRKAVTG